MRIILLPICSALAVIFIASGCSRPDRDMFQGYVEGEYIYIASPMAGALEQLHVRRGTIANAGEPLFSLEGGPEKAARDEAEQRLMQAYSVFEDAKKGKRPSEVESVKAQLEQSRAMSALSEKELSRQENLFASGVSTASALDLARAMHDQNGQRVLQLESDLKTARLGLRADQIKAAEANVLTLKAALRRADWNLRQKRQAAPKAGLVFDTLYHVGEWVAAGKPVVMLLPSENIKVRAFIPETLIGAVHPGDNVQVVVDGAGKPYPGKVSFISPRAEYTPPVIYSRENRSKLVFMIEIVFEPAISANLHPGQPVDIRFGP